MPRATLVWSFLACIASLPSPAAEHENWPGWRGPRSDGASLERNVPTEWDGPSGKNVVWKTPVPGVGHASPIVWNDRIFTVTCHEEAEDRLLGDGATGELLSAPFTVVGKAITFDSGGISIKPSADMDQMKFDKSGGIAVLSTMKAVAELGLGNVQAVQARMQEYQPGRAFDMVISRAVSSLEELYRQSRHLLAPRGRMLFMKGALPEEEMAAFAPGSETLHIERLDVPGLDAERHLLWLDKQG